jgi:hypothetical protein
MISIEPADENGRRAGGDAIISASVIVRGGIPAPYTTIARPGAIALHGLHRDDAVLDHRPQLALSPMEIITALELSSPSTEDVPPAVG